MWRLRRSCAEPMLRMGMRPGASAATGVGTAAVRRAGKTRNKARAILGFYYLFAFILSNARCSAHKFNTRRTVGSYIILTKNTGLAKIDNESGSGSPRVKARASARVLSNQKTGQTPRHTSHRRTASRQCACACGQSNGQPGQTPRRTPHRRTASRRCACACG